MDSQKQRDNPLLTVREIAVFSMLGALMFCSKLVMEWAPNIHLLGMFTMVFTVAFRKKALIPLYLYVMLNGVFAGFATWWVPYLYVWTVLWGVTMLLPKNMSKKAACIVYPVVCCLHGCLFGVLYAPGQALLYGMGWKATLSWIAAGFPFDLIHGLGNLVAGFLILPLSTLCRKLMKQKAHI